MLTLFVYYAKAIYVFDKNSNNNNDDDSNNNNNNNKRIPAFLSHLTSLNDSIVLGTSEIQAYRTRTLTSTHN